MNMESQCYSMITPIPPTIVHTQDTEEKNAILLIISDYQFGCGLVQLEYGPSPHSPR